MEWINVKEQLPSPKETVVVINEYGDMYVASWNNNDFKISCYCEGGGNYVYKPTHWMPLPPPPSVPV